MNKMPSKHMVGSLHKLGVAVNSQIHGIIASQMDVDFDVQHGAFTITFIGQRSSHHNLISHHQFQVYGLVGETVLEVEIKLVSAAERSEEVRIVEALPDVGDDGIKSDWCLALLVEGGLTYSGEDYVGLDAR